MCITVRVRRGLQWAKAARVAHPLVSRRLLRWRKRRRRRKKQQKNNNTIINFCWASCSIPYELDYNNYAAKKRLAITSRVRRSVTRVINANHSHVSNMPHVRIILQLRGDVYRSGGGMYGFPSHCSCALDGSSRLCG